MHHFFTSESVTEGHPDKICDQISDSILDAILAQDPDAHVACECAATTGMVLVMGEISTKAYVPISDIVRKKIVDIGYDRAKYGFDGHSCSVLVSLDEQSPDIAQGVNREIDMDQGAGDQGMMFGYACNETEEYMPLAISLAHKLSRRLTEVRKNGTLPYLRPDGKSQITVEYDDNRVVRIEAVVISTQHAPDVSQEQIREDILKHVVHPVLPEALLDGEYEVFRQSDRSFRSRRSARRLRSDRKKDHRRHLRRLCPPRRRRVLRQGSEQGRPQRRICDAPRCKESGCRRSGG